MESLIASLSSLEEAFVFPVGYMETISTPSPGSIVNFGPPGQGLVLILDCFDGVNPDFVKDS